MTHMNERILIVDDENDILEVLKLRINSAGYEVSGWTSPLKAIEEFKEKHFDLVLTDLKMEEMDGISVLEKILSIDPQTPVIILTAHGTINTAVEAMKLGAYNYLTKPYNDEELLIQIKRAIEKRKMFTEIRNLRKALDERYEFKNIIGRSKKMALIFDQIRHISSIDTTVLLVGESGVGKELIAKTIHFNSLRKEENFIAVNCSALPETLLESEFFGYKKGSFTGAVSDRIGLFQAADGGTIFLDEIGDLPQSLQPKLLRVLEEKEIIPLGGRHAIKVDVRLIVSTNQDLKKLVENGLFREDLFYRICVFPIYIPPLRERKEDIPLLVVRFVEDIATKIGRNPPTITKEAFSKLESYSWPGNVRELHNILERAVIMDDKGRIEGDDIKFYEDEQNKGSTLPVFRDAKIEFEKNYLRKLLTLTKGNISQSAKIAGKYRADLYEMLRKYQINPEEFKISEEKE